MPLRRRNPNNNHNLSNTKRTGERSEAAFLYQATQRSFGICKPWGDSERYDFILDNRPKPNVHLFRVQVKCTDSLRAGAYETRATYTTGSGRAVYTKRDIDFIAAHVHESTRQRGESIGTDVCAHAFQCVSDAGDNGVIAIG